MGQKSNPVTLRLEKTNQNYTSCWYSDYRYTPQLVEDLRIIEYMENCSQQGKRILPVIFLNRVRGEMQVLLFSPRLRRSYGRSYGLKGGFTPVQYRKKDWLCKMFLYYKGGKRYVKERGGILEYLLNSFLFAKSGTSPWHRRVGNERALNSALPRSTSVKASPSCSVAAPECGAAAAMLVKKFNVLDLIKICSSRGSFCTVPISPATRQFQPVAVPSGHPVRHGEGAGAQQPPLPSPRAVIAVMGGASAAVPFRPAPRATTFFRDHLEESIYMRFGGRYKLLLLKCASLHQNPVFIAWQVVSSLQERVPFRRLKHRLIRECSKNPLVKGVRITCSGRVASRSKKAQKARKESIQWGETSLNVFSESVHFASKGAQTTFGKIGVRVWICYNSF